MAGVMDQMIEIQEAVATPDGIGGRTLAWQPLARGARVWASVTLRGGSEAMEDGRINARQTASFEVYARSDLTELHRISWNNEVWNIRSIGRPGDRRMTMIIDAERGVAS